jgi:hypothetical protein
MSVQGLDKKIILLIEKFWSSLSLVFYLFESLWFDFIDRIKSVLVRPKLNLDFNELSVFSGHFPSVFIRNW